MGRYIQVDDDGILGAFGLDVPMVPPSGEGGGTRPGEAPTSWESVRGLQRWLNAHGSRLAVDGRWGPPTARAFQIAMTRLGLPGDPRYWVDLASRMTA